MALDIVISPMKEADLETVVAIEQDSFSDPWPMRSFYSELQQNRLALYYVAHFDGTIIAYIGAWIILDEVHITTLAVHKDYRCRGVATRLFEKLINSPLTQQAGFITLEVRPSNITARRFYEKHGFTVQGARKHYYRDEDALIMTRFLQDMT